MIAESPLDRNLLYTGADDGTIQITRDGGEHWTNLTANVHGLPPMLNISGIVASKYTASRVYLTVDGHFNDDYNPYVFVSEDYGKTWRAIADGLPKTSVHRIREHPANANLLVVAMEQGVYATFDRGAHWTTLDTNLPPVPVYDLAFQERSNALVLGHPRTRHLGAGSYRTAGSIDLASFRRQRISVPGCLRCIANCCIKDNSGSATVNFSHPTRPPAPS